MGLQSVRLHDGASLCGCALTSAAPAPAPTVQTRRRGPWRRAAGGPRAAAGQPEHQSAVSRARGPRGRRAALVVRPAAAAAAAFRARRGAAPAPGASPGGDGAGVGPVRRHRRGRSHARPHLWPRLRALPARPARRRGPRGLAVHRVQGPAAAVGVLPQRRPRRGGAHDDALPGHRLHGGLPGGGARDGRAAGGMRFAVGRRVGGAALSGRGVAAGENAHGWWCLDCLLRTPRPPR